MEPEDEMEGIIRMPNGLSKSFRATVLNQNHDDHELLQRPNPLHHSIRSHADAVHAATLYLTYILPSSTGHGRHVPQHPHAYQNLERRSFCSGPLSALQSSPHMRSRERMHVSSPHLTHLPRSHPAFYTTPQQAFTRTFPSVVRETGHLQQLLPTTEYGQAATSSGQSWCPRHTLRVGANLSSRTSHLWLPPPSRAARPSTIGEILVLFSDHG
ncbi:hypothetical protein CPLU01_08545 [Colletotrichum plurivorum]|uniref:Uncharacterized protein n=1 Tax=Colletotrichum plurivorum TaxID=2175906 RepID=A0A8H6NDB1_9PEZI|nr:hypothetical protein CPLU01_08545 [Colletotrichum plurivorum]